MSDCTHDCSSCGESCAQRESKPEDFLVKLSKGSSVKKVIGVVSGKGGVGKSMVTSLLAAASMREGFKTAILDGDITGPSIPKAFGLSMNLVGNAEGLILPATTTCGIDIVSVNLMLANETDPVIWRGPVLGGVIKQFWGETLWQNIDYMFIDMPPGTGDVPLTIFQSPIDGHHIFMGPEESMQIQSNLGSTIAMAFDECPSSRADRTYIQNSVDRTTRWLERCKKKMQELNSLPDTVNPHQMLFGINQGGVFADIRIEHAKRISELDLDGYAVGGLAVGETHDEMYYILDEVVPYLPENKPTYLMGVGTPANIIEAVDRGIDFFDCVYPSRNGRHGHVYTHHGKLNLFNKKFELDPRPIEEGCQCPACRTYSRAYIRHLLKAKEMLGMRLCVLHNLYFYNHLMEEIRGAIDEHRYKEFKKTTLEGFLTPEEEYR